MEEIRLGMKKYDGLEGQCRETNTKMWSWDKLSYPGHLCYFTLFTDKTSQWHFNQDPMTQKSIQDFFIPFIYNQLLSHLDLKNLFLKWLQASIQFPVSLIWSVWVVPLHRKSVP